MSSFHPLDYGQWVAYLSYAEQQIRVGSSLSSTDGNNSTSAADLKAAYAAFLGHFPLSSTAWVRMSRLQSTAAERCAVLASAVGNSRYCPVLHHQLLLANIEATQSRSGTTMPSLAQLARDALFYVGAHPDSVDVWNLIIDSDILSCSEIVSYIALTSPRFVKALMKRIQNTKANIDSLNDSISYDAIIAAAEAAWAARAPLEGALRQHDEFQGQPSAAAGKLRSIAYIS